MAVKKILVVANETLGGSKLVELIRAKRAEGDVALTLVVPQTRPRHGAVIYDEAVRDAAQVRVDLAQQFMKAEGASIEGEVGDPDPYTAAMDAIGFYRPDEVIVSTLPQTTSGWLRRDLVERIEQSSGLPVEHVVTDLDSEGLPFDVTLVLANQTIGEASLLEALKAKALDDSAHLFVIVVPQENGEGHAAVDARHSLHQGLRAFRSAGLIVAGMIGPPDPYDAAMNAMQSFRFTDVIVSTLEPLQSGWLRQHIVERLREATGKDVTHVIAGQDIEIESGAT